MAKQRDRILPRLIEDEMRDSFIDYSMSVIVQRALPDVRDGLKPVHRRILYAMHESGLSPSRPFKKSATVVGDVLGRYHPHGDASVYDALVRMVQDFSLRYPLIAGQGNFGSIDGDSAAAYRYTESRLAPISMEMLSDIDKKTVNFAPNYDDRLEEPTVLPAKLPNLLVNGSSGIAVGMSTNVPPHNLREVVDAAALLLEKPDCTIAELMRRLPGPDFPTGGLIVGTKGIRDAYEKGRGRVVMRARAVLEQKRGGREQLVVTEIPFLTNKVRIIEQIADLVKAGRISDISDLRDESDREGIRLVIELKRGADAKKVLQQLFKGTALQSTFGVITLALDNGVPKEFSLKELLERWRDHRVQVIVRRSEWELGRARDEAHVLEGLLVALKHIDEVVKLIRSSKTRESAAAKLEKQFKLTEIQANAILNMRLAKLTALESQELKNRLKELEARIRELEALLASPERQIAVIRAELEELKEKYGDARRTRILADDAPLALEEATAEEEVVVAISRGGFAKQIPMSLYRRRGAGRLERWESDFLEHVFFASTGDTLLFFTEDGKAYPLAVDELPDAGPAARGRLLNSLLGIPRKVRIVAQLKLPREAGDAALVFATAGGTVKRTELREYLGAKSGGVQALVLARGDRLIDVQPSDGGADLVLASGAGRVIRFAEADVPLMGRVAQGVRGIKLGMGDECVGMVVVHHAGTLAMVTEHGWVKRIALGELPTQKRDGLGALLAPSSAAAGTLIGAREMQEGDELVAISAAGQMLRLNAERVEIEEKGGSGEPLLTLAPGDSLIGLAHAADREEEGEVEALEEREDEADSAEFDELEEVEAEGDAEELDAVTSAGTPSREQFDLL